MYTSEEPAVAYLAYLVRGGKRIGRARGGCVQCSGVDPFFRTGGGGDVKKWQKKIGALRAQIVI